MLRQTQTFCWYIRSPPPRAACSTAQRSWTLASCCKPPKYSRLTRTK